MPKFANITGLVTYIPGDGVPIEIPKVRIEVALAPDSATLSWEPEPGVTGVTAIPRDRFDKHVQDGEISWIPDQAI